MAIQSLPNNNFNYDLYKNQQPVSFGGLTAKGAGIPADGYYQANVQQGVPSTLPQVQGIIPTTEDMEAADKFAQLNVSGATNIFETGKIGTSQSGYVPQGNGEISPVIDGREDKIKNCPWEEYYA